MVSKFVIHTALDQLLTVAEAGCTSEVKQAKFCVFPATTDEIVSFESFQFCFSVSHVWNKTLKQIQSRWGPVCLLAWLSRVAWLIMHIKTFNNTSDENVEDDELLYEAAVAAAAVTTSIIEVIYSTRDIID